MKHLPPADLEKYIPHPGMTQSIQSICDEFVTLQHKNVVYPNLMVLECSVMMLYKRFKHMLLSYKSQRALAFYVIQAEHAHVVFSTLCMFLS